jgi:hypothetical protein
MASVVAGSSRSVASIEAKLWRSECHRSVHEFKAIAEC